MKNDMGIIMESWRSSSVLSEAATPHSDDWMGTITVREFLESIAKGDNPDKISKANEAIEIIKKRFPKQWEKLSGEQQSKFEKAWPSIFEKVAEAGESEGTGWLAGLISSGFTAKSIAAAAVAFGITGPIWTSIFLASATVLASIGVSHAVNKLYKLSINAVKGVKGMAAMDIPDGELDTNNAANAYDISDSTKAVIYGPDKQLDKEESVALALGYKELAEWTKKINNEVGRLSGQALEDYKNKKLSEVGWTTSINTIVRQKYGEIIGIQQDTVIPKP